MIITQYEARKLYGMSITALQKKAKKVPRPTYFIDTKNSTAPRIDDANPEFLAYVKLIESKKKPVRKGSDKDLMRLIDAVTVVITERYSKDEADEIQKAIIQELKDRA